MTTLCDSTTPAEIPSETPMVAGYVDGKYAWTPQDWRLFPLAVKVTITVTGLAGMDVADVETGNLTPASGAGWAMRELQAGRRPTIYCDQSTKPDVITALALVGVDVADVDWWIADPTGVPHALPGAVAVQYAWAQLGQTGGLNLDISETNGVWPATIGPPVGEGLDVDVATVVDGTQTKVFVVSPGGTVTYWWQDTAAPLVGGKVVWNTQVLPGKAQA